MDRFLALIYAVAFPIAVGFALWESPRWRRLRGGELFVLMPLLLVAGLAWVAALVRLGVR